MTTTHRAEEKDELRFETLKVVVLTKITTVRALAEASGIGLRDVEGALEELAASGDVVCVDGRVLPTGAGEARVRRYADRRYGSLRVDTAVQRWRSRYESINRRYQETVSTWKSAPVGDLTVVIHHTDSEYNARVISRIDALIVRMTELLDEISGKVPRMARYKDRLEAAMEKVDQGDERFICDAGVDSAHTIWREMHEAVLIVLGKDREGQ